MGPCLTHYIHNTGLCYVLKVFFTFVCIFCYILCNKLAHESVLVLLHCALLFAFIIHYNETLLDRLNIQHSTCLFPVAGYQQRAVPHWGNPVDV